MVFELAEVREAGGEVEERAEGEWPCASHRFVVVGVMLPWVDTRGGDAVEKKQGNRLQGAGRSREAQQWSMVGGLPRWYLCGSLVTVPRGYRGSGPTVGPAAEGLQPSGRSGPIGGGGG